MPSALQAVGWALRPLPFMETPVGATATTFTLRVRRGQPVGVSFSPQDVGKVLERLTPEFDARRGGRGQPAARPAGWGPAR